MTKFTPLAAAALVLLGTAAARADDTLDQALLRKAAPDVIAYLKKLQPRDKHPLLYVGVLKFAVTRDGVEPKAGGRNVGPINLALAHRLETALILSLDTADKIGVLERPNGNLAGFSRYDTSKPDGRRAMFQVDDFRLAWGVGDEHRNLAADVFLTGEAKLSADLSTVEVKVLAFDRANPDRQPAVVSSFRSQADTRTIAEVSQSFDLLTRGKGFTLKDVLGSQQAIAANTQPHPALGGDCPVRLTIMYDGAPQEPKLLPGGLVKVPEPKEAEGGKPATRVEFVLRNTSAKERFGVVLKVNGLNTLYEEDAPADLCHKWILDPGDKLTVTGFQQTSRELKKFEVLPVDLAMQKVNFGKIVGTYQMIVFPENPEPRYALTAAGLKALEGDLPADVLAKLEPLTSREFTSRSEFLAAVAALVTPEELKRYDARLADRADRDRDPDPSEERKKLEATLLSPRPDPDPDRKKPGTLAELQSELRDYGREAKVAEAGRGLVTGGETAPFNVKRVSFRAMQQPVVSSVIYYYDPNNK